MVGLAVIVVAGDRAVALERTVFAAALQDYRPLAVYVVGAEMTALDRIRALVPEVGIHAAAAGTAVEGRFLAVLRAGDLVYPEGHRLLIEALQGHEGEVAFGGALTTEVDWSGVVPITVAKRRVVDGQAGFWVLDRHGAEVQTVEEALEAWDGVVRRGSPVGRGELVVGEVMG